MAVFQGMIRCGGGVVAAGPLLCLARFCRLLSGTLCKSCVGVEHGWKEGDG